MIDHGNDDEDDDDDDKDDDDDEIFLLSDDDSRDENNFMEIVDNQFPDTTATGSTMNISDNVKIAIESVMTDFHDTPMESTVKQFGAHIVLNPAPFSTFYGEQHDAVNELFHQSFPENKKYTAKNTNTFLTKFQSHISSSTFKNKATKLLATYNVPVDGPEYQFLSGIMFYIEKECLTILDEKLELLPPQPFSVPCGAQLNPSALAKIRYVGGYVVAKIKYNISKRLKDVLFAKGKEKIVQHLKYKMHCVNSLTISHEEISNTTSDPDTLIEIARKQNAREGLTNITDKAFDFFLRLEDICRDRLSQINLEEKGKNLFSFTYAEICAETVLFTMWINLISECALSAVVEKDSNLTPEGEDVHVVHKTLDFLITSCENCTELFNSVVELFLKVSFSQFRRNFLTFYKKEKIKALRKRVQARKAISGKADMNLKSIQEDQSNRKTVSHYRLKSALAPATGAAYFMDRKFTKNDLLLLCQAYGVAVPRNKKKGEIACKLREKILECDDSGIPFPEKL